MIVTGRKISKEVQSIFIDRNYEINSQQNIFNMLCNENLYFGDLVLCGGEIGFLKENTIYMSARNYSGRGKKVIVDNMEDECQYSRYTSLYSKIKSIKVKKPDYSFYMKGYISGKKWVADYYKENNILNMALITNHTLFNHYYLSIIKYLVKNEAITKEPYNNTGKNKVTIGIDGELELVGRDHMVLDTSRSSALGSTIESNSTAEIGLDYCGGPVELRPKAGGTSMELVNNTKKLFIEISKDTQKHKMSVIGDQQALGCHIHFGVGERYSPSRELLDLLDYFIGKPFVDLSGTRRQEYKQLGTYEVKPHGFEYRTPPSAIMRNPRILKIICKVGLAITSKFVNGEPIEIDITSFSNSDGMSKATSNDYKRLCLTNSESKYLENFIETYHENISYKENTIAAWTTQKRKK